LSEYEGKEDKHPLVVARRVMSSLLETILAKEAKTVAHLVVEIT
jgi:hypothetical protein